jgi:hypothetical protein
LIEARKDKIKHGQWLEWLGANCPDIPDRTASRYMKLANNKAKIEKWAVEKSATLADMTLAEAERVAGQTEQSSQGGPEGQPAAKSKPDKPKSQLTTTDKYNKAENELIARLKDFDSLNAVRLAAHRTIGAINDTLEDLEAEEKKKKGSLALSALN